MTGQYGNVSGGPDLFGAPGFLVALYYSHYSVVMFSHFMYPKFALTLTRNCHEYRLSVSNSNPSE